MQAILYEAGNVIIDLFPWLPKIYAQVLYAQPQQSCG